MSYTRTVSLPDLPEDIDLAAITERHDAEPTREELRELMDEIIASEPPLDIDEIAADLEEIGRWLAREKALTS